ncbi:hypothetical protein FOZ62_020624, partial [Perkinsus olseni]
ASLYGGEISRRLLEVLRAGLGGQRGVPVRDIIRTSFTDTWTRGALAEGLRDVPARRQGPCDGRLWIPHCGLWWGTRILSVAGWFD